MKMAARKATTGFVLAFAMLSAMAAPAAADDACTGFTWPVETEIAWMTAPDIETVETGAKLPAPPAQAVALKLKPAKEAALPVKSGVKKQAIASAAYSGWFEIASLPKSGLYQISLSHEGWIDAVQHGEVIESQTFTGSPACKAMHKSVRYELGGGPLSIQISGAPVETVKVSIREAN